MTALGTNQQGRGVDIDGELKRDQLERIQSDLNEVLQPKRRRRRATKQNRKPPTTSPQRDVPKPLYTERDVIKYQKYKQLYDRMQNILTWFRDRPSDKTAAPSRGFNQQLGAQPSPIKREAAATAAAGTPRGGLQVNQVQKPRMRRKSHSELIAAGRSRNLRSRKKGTALLNWQTLDNPQTPINIKSDDPRWNDLIRWSKKRRLSASFSRDRGPRNDDSDD